MEIALGSLAWLNSEEDVLYSEEAHFEYQTGNQLSWLEMLQFSFQKYATIAS